MQNKDLKTAKVAIIHDWLDGNFGAEKVLRAITELFPQADIFALVDFMAERDRAFLKGHKITTSFIQKIPFSRKYFRLLLPIFPFAIRRFKLAKYDLVISSSHAIAKGVKVKKHKHICYIHTPIRYAYDMQDEYLARHNYGKIKSCLAKFFLKRIKRFDQKTDNVGLFIANSSFVAQRVRNFYKRKAKIIYPPVSTDFFKQRTKKKEDFFVTCSRLVPYKNTKFLLSCLAACPNEKLYVIGTGPEEEELKRIAPPNVIFLGKVSDAELKKYITSAKAFLYAAIEDFGIVMVESLAAGTPIIAYKKGGALDIVSANKTGVFFTNLTPNSFKKAIREFKKLDFKPATLRKEAEKFSEENFKQKLLKEVENFYAN